MLTVDWKDRLNQALEPVLMLPDPRSKISAYHDMPFAIFQYPPEAEFALRSEVSLLKTRLEQQGKRVTVVSLAECLHTAIEAVMPVQTLVEAEKAVGLDATLATLHQILAEYQPLAQLVAQRVRANATPRHDIVVLTRAGALFPIYRTSSLLEQLKGLVSVPVVLFYPGTTDGAAGLRFMDVLDAEHNYRPRIF